MNAEILLKHFDRISDAPDAVPRLRRFIFGLAVRGKLVAPDPNDKPASELVGRIRSQSITLEKSGKIRIQRGIPQVTADRLPFIAPKHWAWLVLREIGVLSGGMTPSKNRAEYWDGDINWFSPKDIKTDELVRSELKITLAGVSETGLQLYAPGCLFMVARSGILKRTFPVAINRVNATVNQDLKVLTPFVEGLERYLQIMFKGMTDFILCDLVKTGTTVQSLKYDEFESQPFPLPPLAEQRRIVAKVDELMLLCDRLEEVQKEREARRDRLTAASLHHLNNGADGDELRENARFFINHLPKLTARSEQVRQIRQTIFSLAVCGHIVRQDLNEEPAIEQIAGIRKDRTALARTGSIRGAKALTPVAGTEIPFSIPSSWRWVKIGDAVLSTDYGTSHQSGHFECGIPVLKMGDIQDGALILGGQKTVPPSIDDLPALYLEKYDLLYNRTNSAELVGKTGIYLGEERAYTFASYLIRIRCSLVNSDPLYINLAMNAPYFRATQIIPNLKQQCGQANVNGTILKNMIIPFPPVAEQRRIVAKVEQLAAICDQLQGDLSIVQHESRKLLDEVLRRAMRTDELAQFTKEAHTASHRPEPAPPGPCEW